MISNPDFLTQLVNVTFEVPDWYINTFTESIGILRPDVSTDERIHPFPTETGLKGGSRNAQPVFTNRIVPLNTSVI